MSGRLSSARSSIPMIRLGTARAAVALFEARKTRIEPSGTPPLIRDIAGGITQRRLPRAQVTGSPLGGFQLSGSSGGFTDGLVIKCKTMPLYRIYRMKDLPRQQFRWAPHVSGCAAVKPRDFEQAGEVEALHEYDAWRALRDSGEPLEVGDLLELDNGQLRICKYVGFEPASWVLPQPKAEHAPMELPPESTPGGQPSLAS